MWPFTAKKSYPTLARAVHNGDLRAVREMLERGDDPNSYDPEYKAHAIHFAIGRLSWETADSQESVEIVKLLVKHGADVNQPSGGRLPLWVAEAGKHSEVVAVLRSAGARLRIDDDKLSLAPAKEREIRKVARDYARQISMISPHYTKEQLAEAVEGKFVIQPDPHASGDDYAKFREQMRLVIRDEIGV
jgi:hypothetical protein